MTFRALLWCGTVRPDGRTVRDRACSIHDLNLAMEAAHLRGVRPENVWAFVCRDDLLPYPFVGRVRRADVASLRLELEAISKLSVDDDRLLIVAANHGGPLGLNVEPSLPLDEFDEAPPPPLAVSPDVLREVLDPIRGQQVLLLGTCHAQLFLPLGVGQRRVVYCAVTQDQQPVSFLSEDDQPRTPLLERILGHWSGVAFAGEPAPRPSPVSFSDAFALFEKAVPSSPRGDAPIVPQSAGSATW